MISCHATALVVVAGRPTKVQILLEGHKIWKKSPTIVLKLLGNVKTKWEVFSNVCGLLTISELYNSSNHGTVEPKPFWSLNIYSLYHFDFAKFQLLLSRTEKFKNIPRTLKEFTFDFENVLAPLCIVLGYFMTYVQCTYNMQSISRYAFVGKFDIFPKKPVGNTT